MRKKKEKVKAKYVLLFISDEGQKIFNSFALSDEDKWKTDVIFDKFTTYLEPKLNLQIDRYQLQGFRQADNESVDLFMAKYKVQGQKCRFIETELEEHLIKQLFIGTRDWKVQEVLLEKMRN